MTPLQPQPKGKNSKEFRTLYDAMLREALKHGDVLGLDFGDSGLMMSDDPKTTQFLNTLEADFAALTDRARVIHPRFMPYFKEDGALFARVVELRCKPVTSTPQARPARNPNAKMDDGSGKQRTGNEGNEDAAD